ncbi:related to RMD1-Protein required for Meiotic Division [Serendipita indica DSM 11827]|uniref:Related to RMD1-Protein required for Meiotic Division n=1 Tax=Serendipita indica (strain DSM 11827) TaxID=1109443 RepID=G4TL43_SERID|nr:related to RMD1-Protein required for Meiotic Division [Serendipita indica DSM 11827]
MSSAGQAVLPTVNPKSADVATSTSTTARAAKRTTKAAQKLQVLPDTPEPLTQSQLLDETRRQLVDEGLDVEQPQTSETSPAEDELEVYQQIAQIPEGTARADALRLTKNAIKKLPRVTAYCTASSYNFDEIVKFLKARKSTYETDPRILDDAIYTPYTYRNAPQRPKRPGSISRGSRSRPSSPAMGDLLRLDEDPRSDEAEWNRSNSYGKGRIRELLTDIDDMSDVFIFKYGTVVIWGMTEDDEQRFISSIKRFAEENLSSAEMQMEDLRWYTASYSRIYNDVITLRKGSSYMTKLSLSHALAQSAKISLFEDRIAATIAETKNIPDMIAETGAITMPHDDIMKQIGKVFLLRMNVNHVGSILDAPEIFWKFPDLQPLYEAAREYLELPQRLEVLNSRVDVLQDMLKLLKESVTSRHSERLEQIVIALIAVEIILGLMTIAVDLFSPAYELPS